MVDGGPGKSRSIQRSSVRRALFSCSKASIRAWARCRAAASLRASSCPSALVESVISLPSLLARCFQCAADRFIGDAVAVRDLAEGIASLSAAQDIGPLVAGNSPTRYSRPRTALLWREDGERQYIGAAYGSSA